jgi:hypothetical protein
VLGQNRFKLHLRSHLHMLALAAHEQDLREVIGQLCGSRWFPLDISWAGCPRETRGEPLSAHSRRCPLGQTWPSCCRRHWRSSRRPMGCPGNCLPALSSCLDPDEFGARFLQNSYNRTVLSFRRHRLLTVLVALVSLLSMQLAVAGVRLPCRGQGRAKSLAMAEAGMPCAGDMATVDTEQPTLCHAHCESAHQTARQGSGANAQWSRWRAALSTPIEPVRILSAGAPGSGKFHACCEAPRRRSRCATAASESDTPERLTLPASCGRRRSVLQSSGVVMPVSSLKTCPSRGRVGRCCSALPTWAAGPLEPARSFAGLAVGSLTAARPQTMRQSPPRARWPPPQASCPTPCSSSASKTSRSTDRTA